MGWPSSASSATPKQRRATHCRPTERRKRTYKTKPQLWAAVLCDLDSVERLKNMRVLTCFSLSLLVGCSQLQIESRPNFEMSSLIGTWCTRSPDGQSCVDHHEYFPNMTVRSCAVDSLYNKHVLSSAAIQLNGNAICMKVTESTETIGTPIGYEFCFNALEFTPDLIKYRALPHGEIFFDKRLPTNAPKCPPLAN